MDPIHRLFDATSAFDHPFTMGASLGVAAALIIAPAIIVLFACLGWVDAQHRGELIKRCGSWVELAVLLMAPVLLGAAWVIVSVCALSLLCYREYARATGLFRHRTLSALVVLGVLAETFAVADHWYAMFVALWPLAICALAAAAIVSDRPEGYIQRVALAVFAFALFGAGLGHLGYLSNDVLFRPMVIWLVLCVELNDVFGYIVGKSVGKRKLAPNTSPNKTVAGAAGALVLTTALAALLGHFVFAGTTIDRPIHLILLGLIISVTGQCGDLMLSSIKRDLHIKDIGATIPGHGGLLDRFDSLLLAAPAVFHYLGYFKANGIGLDQPTRIITGS